ncbi:MAG: hypothetical protein ABSG53_03380 [Thermoguttaceae bacterium]
MTCGKRKTAWLVIVLYATTVCAGEGLHLLPGCGHIVQLPGGHLSWDALVGDDHASECSHDDRLGHATEASHPTHDADGCPICKLCLLPVYGGSTAAPVSAELILCSAIWFSEPKVSRNVGSSFLSRAPPTV